MNEVLLKSGKAIILNQYKKGNRLYYTLKCCVCDKEFDLRHDHLKNRIGCNKCNTILVKRPELLAYFNEEDKKVVSDLKLNSKAHFDVVCPECGNIKDSSIVNLTNNGFSCDICSDNIPFGERFLKEVFKQLLANNIFQFSKKHSSWCDCYKYDFYIETFNIIVETHGLQHYRDCSWGKLRDILKNDETKKRLAKNNGIDNYIILDCRESNGNWIKNSILKSELSNFYDLSNIDWRSCEKNASKSYLNLFCNYWNYVSKSLSDIAKHYGVSEQLVRKYLKIGRDNNMCDYSENNQKSHKGINEKKCICLTTGKVYGSINEASEDTGISVKSISNCCNGWSKTAGKMNWSLH